MADNFTVRVLTLAVNKMKPVKTIILDKVFKRKKRSLTGILAWDVKTSSNNLMESIATSAEATVRGGLGKVEVTCNAPRYATKELISADSIADMRKFGATAETELLKERVAEEQADMRANVDLTREYQAVKALEGVVVDKNGKVLVDYKFPAEMKPVLAGTALWTDPLSTPIKNLRAWKKIISRACGGVVSEFVAYCGSGAMDALIDNPNVLEKLKFVLGQQIAEEGRVARLAKITIEEYDGTFTDDAGTVHDMIPDDVFVLVGIVYDGAAELFAPVIDLDAPAGVGKGKEADMFFSKMWDVKDPSGKWIKIESRPLPVLTRLVAVWAKVI
jgi:major capsid protein E